MPGSEHRVLSNIIVQYPSPISESIEARYRLLELERAQGDAAAVNARLQELIRVDATAGSQRSDRTRFLAAKASLELAEPGTLFVERNFATLDFSGPRRDRVMRVTVWDVDGDELWTKELQARDLRP